MRRNLRAIVLAAVLATLTATHAGTQSAAPAFEVASIKESSSLEIDGVFKVNPGRFTVTNLPLRAIVQYAYSVRPYQVFGLPAWASTAYNIEATFAQPTGANADVRVMVQNLLADRFGLEIRREKRAIQGYSLAVARSDHALGPNLVPVSEDCAKFPPELANTRVTDALQERRTPQCAMLAGNSTIRAFQRPLGPVVQQLEQIVGAPIVDKTGLTGNFDLTLRWEGPKGIDAAAAQGMENFSSLFAALVDQLGLKLESARVDADLIVVTTVHRPVPN